MLDGPIELHHLSLQKPVFIHSCILKTIGHVACCQLKARHNTESYFLKVISRQAKFAGVCWQPGLRCHREDSSSPREGQH